MAVVIAVARGATHSFSKVPQASIRLVAGLGVEDDAHQGSTVRHRSRVARDPTQPNLRQVHLIHAELHDELRASAYGAPIADGGGPSFQTSRQIAHVPPGWRFQIHR